jgi:2-keto-4-pentenoate hydratase/2-oxohepta-3-ene-1,7-dioic acid hydratase in catechol pathway
VKLATFLPPDATAPVAGEVREQRAIAFLDATSVRDRLASGDRTPAAGPWWPLADVTLLAPVPQPRAIFGIGLNYAAHAAEGGRGAPEAPIVFMKTPAWSRPAARSSARPSCGGSTTRPSSRS